MSLTYSSHGVDAVNVVVRPACGQLVGVLLFLYMDTKIDWVKWILIYTFKMLQYTSGGCMYEDVYCVLDSQLAWLFNSPEWDLSSTTG